MAINFQNLPTENPFALPPEGKYFFTVVAADVKTAQSGNEYINMRFKLYDHNMEDVGQVWDRLIASDKKFPLYKMSRFIRAIGIDPTAIETLEDLALVCKGRKGIVDVIHKNNDRTGAPQLETRFYGTDFYWSVDEASEQFPEATAFVDSDSPLPFDLESPNTVDEDEEEAEDF